MARTWTLRKTLARKTDYRPIELEDVRYAWAAYRVGALKASFGEGLGPAEFKAKFSDMVVSRFDAAWTLLADTKQGYAPAGIAFGFYPHPEAMTFLILNNIAWFPWATPRNRIESAVNFFEKARHEVSMIGFSNLKDKPFYETVAKHGLLRRVGTSMNVFANEPAAIWETRGFRDG